MWNPFRHNPKNKKQGAETSSQELPCVALHELVSGDVRALICSTDGDLITSFSYLGPHAGAVEYHPDDFEYITRHVADKHYMYGTIHAPEINEAIIYEELAHRGYPSYTILYTSPLGNDYHAWVAVDTDEITRSLRHKHNQVIDTGLAGVGELFGLGHDHVFLFVSVERYESLVALVRGGNVLFQEVVSVGTSVVVRTVADTLNCPIDMARRVVEAHGVLDTHYDPRLRDRITASLLPLTTAMRELVNIYNSQPYKPAFMRSDVHCWMLGGIGASVPGLAGLLGLSVSLDFCDEITPRYKKMLVEMPKGPTKDILPRYYMVMGLAISSLR